MQRDVVQRLALPAVAFAILWALLIRQIGNSWSVVPQYNYGWFTPLLTLVIWWGRWKTRPNPVPFPSGKLLVAAAAVLIFALAPIRLIQEPNRDWVFVSWGLALIATALTALGVLWTGGWPWVRHFLFPLLFPLVAVPWPSKIEQPVVHDLMAVVAAIGAEVLSAAGIPAMARGSVVEIGRGLVGIDEACSGIQSFQASVMVALFVGELFAFGTVRRWVILVSAMVWAFLCNLGRTLFLTYICDRDGFPALDRLHDSAGVVVMLICYAGIIVLAVVLAGKVPQPKPTTPSGGARRIGARFSVVALVWVLAAELGTLAWYRRNSENFAGRTRWTVELKKGQANFREHEFSGRERTILRYNDAQAATWTAGDDHRWRLSFIRWDAGNLAVTTARNHHPSVCLTGSGWVMKEEYPTRTYKLAGLDIPFRSFRFAQGKEELISFFCIWDDRDRPVSTGGEAWNQEHWTARYRLQNVMEARRTTGLQLLNASVFGIEDWETAAREFGMILSEVGVAR